jgi:hypothetical protein
VVDVRGRLGIVLLIALGCGTTGAARPRPERVGAVLTQVLSAEAEQMGIDTRAHHLRRQARRQYQEATLAMASGDMTRATRLFDRAEVDAELSVALARQEVWTQQAHDRSAALLQLRADLAQPGGTR